MITQTNCRRLGPSRTDPFYSYNKYSSEKVQNQKFLRFLNWVLGKPSFIFFAPEPSISPFFRPSFSSFEKAKAETTATNIAKSVDMFDLLLHHEVTSLESHLATSKGFTKLATR